MAEKKQATMEVHIDERAQRGSYSNAVKIQHTPLDFRLDFSQVIPDERRINVLSRIYLSPAHAKMLLGALEDNIKKYESQFGAITLPKQDANFDNMAAQSVKKH